MKNNKGLKLKNWGTGYSREFGEGGSYWCDIFVGDINIGKFLQAGDGGEYDFYPSSPYKECREFVKNLCKNFKAEFPFLFCSKNNWENINDLENMVLFIHDLLPIWSDKLDIALNNPKGLNSIIYTSKGMKEQYFFIKSPFIYSQDVLERFINNKKTEFDIAIQINLQRFIRITDYLDNIEINFEKKEEKK